jgi:hypothetical protein
MPEFVTIATADGEIADVNLDIITHMRPNPANKAQIIIHFVGRAGLKNLNRTISGVSA